VKTGTLTNQQLFEYWNSLLSIQPTGNAMVDASTNEEIRIALRDALILLKTMERRLSDLEPRHLDKKSIDSKTR
jgi:hypothetical protein